MLGALRLQTIDAVGGGMQNAGQTISVPAFNDYSGFNAGTASKSISVQKKEVKQ